MGMFDSFYDQYGGEWQTKAYWCNLEVFVLGDQMPPVAASDLADYQVEVLGGPRGEFIDAFTTVREGVVSAIGVEREPTLPRLDYFGHLVALGATQ